MPVISSGVREGVWSVAVATDRVLTGLLNPLEIARVRTVFVCDFWTAVGSQPAGTDARMWQGPGHFTSPCASCGFARRKAKLVVTMIGDR
jgi:hypothetical protein